VRARSSGQLESLPGEQFPGSVLLLPDLERADLDAGELAVGLALGLVEVACNCRVADYCDGDLGKVIDFTIAFRVMTPSMN